MNILKFFMIATFTFGSNAFAAAPSFTFDSNQDQKSYRFTIGNETNEAITCSLIEISAKVGTGDCSDSILTYKHTVKNQVFKPNSKLENSNFGIDFLARKNKSQADRSLIYCGQPEVKFNCK